MTTVSKSFTLSKPIAVAWSFLNDFDSVGKCLPGCQEVRVQSDTRSFWKIKVSVGIVSRIMETEVTKKADEPNKTIDFHIESRNGDLRGDMNVSLRPSQSAGSTDVDLNFDAQAIGSFSWIVNQMIGRQSDKMITQFVECVNSGVSSK